MEGSKLAEQKKALRKQIKALKKTLPESQRLEKSANIFKQVEALELFQNANTVLVYWSMNDEVHTHDFVLRWWKQKTILLPAVDGDILRLKVFTGMDCLKNGELMQIPEPVGPDFEDISSIDLIVVPGVAFDKNNYRMGRGRGFYDKLLATTATTTLGVCFDFQFVAKVPVEAHDKAMSRVIKA